jgi:hypothetical protein
VERPQRRAGTLTGGREDGRSSVRGGALLRRTGVVERKPFSRSRVSSGGQPGVTGAGHSFATPGGMEWEPAAAGRAQSRAGQSGGSDRPTSWRVRVLPICHDSSDGVNATDVAVSDAVEHEGALGASGPPCPSRNKSWNGRKTRKTPLRQAYSVNSGPKRPTETPGEPPTLIRTRSSSPAAERQGKPSN